MKTKWMTFLVVATAALGLFAKSSSKTFTYGDIELEPEDSLTFSLTDDLPETINGMEVLTDFLPEGIDVEWTGKKFKTPKATKVKYNKEDEDFSAKKEDRDNYCSLKISVKKNGSVSGSFKVYLVKSEKKLKTVTAKVSGKLGGTLKVTVKGAGGSYEATLE